jgi:hypothetical protein
VHCVTERQARLVLAALGDRMGEVGLRLHPGKTRIVYCRDKWRRGSQEHTSFDFLGFTFRQRRAKDRNGQMFMRFLPAISKHAQKKISREVRSWRVHRQIGLTLAGLARRINPVISGWMRYYGRFYRSALYPLLARINAYLVQWLRKKYRRLAGLKKALRAMAGAAKRYPRLFAHWQWTTSASLTW